MSSSQEESSPGTVLRWDSNQPKWGYFNQDDGTSEWGLNFPEANGENQSPINVNSRESQYDETLNETPLALNYVISRETDILNNGHTAVVYFKGEGIYRGDVLPRSVMSGGPLPAGHEFELCECRFHWGKEDARGSEHTVNFKAFPMELHLIHWNCTLYDSFEDALGKPHGVTIIASFVQIGREHTGLKLLIEQLEDIQYKGKLKTVTTHFNPNCLLPDPLLRDFWTYEGSLTSPPCSEQVTWVIFRYPLTLSRPQIDEFRRLRTHTKREHPTSGEDGNMVDNFRPTQPLNDRIVKASFQ